MLNAECGMSLHKAFIPHSSFLIPNSTLRVIFRQGKNPACGGDSRLVGVPTSSECR